MIDQKVYISGKITGTSDYMERFSAAEDHLKEMGYKPVNPARLNAFFPDGTALETYMRSSIVRSSIDMLLDCDAIYLLKDWEESRGARLEKDIAVALNMVIIMETGK